MVRFFLFLFALFFSSLSVYAENHPLGLQQQIFQKNEKQDFAFFLPPQNWKPTPPSKDKPHMVLSFVEEKSKGFRPSISLATEKTSVSLSDYLKAVKKLHESSPSKTWRKLGTFPTKAGNAALTQIDIHSEGSTLRMLQLVLIKDNTAYIINAAAEKSKISEYYPVFEKAFSSFTITADLLDCVQDVTKREKLSSVFKEKINAYNQQKTDAKKAVSELAIFLQKEFQDLGIFWQALVAKEFMAKLEQTTLIEPAY